MNDKQHPANPRLWLTADIVFGASLILGFILHYFRPLSFGSLGSSVIHHLIGAPLLLMGGVIIVLSKRELQRMGESSEPGLPTAKIVRTGPYRYSRNPLYVGLALCFGGLAFAIDMPWLLILLLPMLLTTQFLLIRPEEKYLEARFGDEYIDYKKSVRRWF